MKQKSPLCRSFTMLFLTILFATIACKSQAGSESAGVAAHPLEKYEVLKKFPAGSVGFMIWDLESPFYEQFRKSPWGESAIDLFSTMGGNTEVASAFDVLNKSVKEKEFWNSLHTRVSTFAASLYFVDTKSVMGFAAITEAKTEAAVDELQTFLKQHLESELFSISKEGEIYSAIHPGKELSLYYISQGKYFYLSTQKEIVAGIAHADSTSTGLTSLIADPAFAEAVNKLPARNKEYFLGYLYTDNILDRLPKEAVASLGVSTGIPIRSVAINRTVAEGPLDSVAIALTEKGRSGPLLTALSGHGNLTALDTLPAESILGIGIDGALIAHLISDAYKTLPNAAASVPEVDISKFNSIISVGLGFEDVAPGSLFPSICLSLTSAPGSDLAAELKKITDTQMKSSAGMQMAWQQKKIEEVPVQYFLTPLGVGMYLAELPAQILLATSEPALKKMILASKNGNGHSTALPASVQKLTTPDTLLRLTVSFPAVATAVRNLSGSLAMFTGGQAMYEEKQLKALETFGMLAVSISYKDGTFLIQNHYTEVPKT